ncbi:hypothetical protein F0562_014481 [Nyssa sinensis]|uniref:Uncharacterized protein n=1 Tax=Nyssa sinensis TaxID=561372 RepID=A0A5J4ZNK2_9ASTE|nr:hypothetical protein F0562_014481 [Nyssa sinensis]
MGSAISILHFPCKQTHDNMMTSFEDCTSILIHQLQQSTQNIDRSHQRMVDKFDQINKELAERIEHQTRVFQSLLKENSENTKGLSACDHHPILHNKNIVHHNTSCFTPNCRNPSNHDWKRHNIFKTTANCGGKLCSLAIDGGSSVNVVATHLADKLKLAKEPHPWPYRMAWCDVVPMSAADILLGRPWLYDRNVFHDGHENTYSFKYNRGEFILIPQKPKEDLPSSCTLEEEEEEENFEMKLW